MIPPFYTEVDNAEFLYPMRVNYTIQGCSVKHFPALPVNLRLTEYFKNAAGFPGGKTDCSEPEARPF